MHNEEDESLGRYAAACIRQLGYGQGSLDPESAEARRRVEAVAGAKIAALADAFLRAGAAVWFFTHPTQIRCHTVLTPAEQQLCRDEVMRREWCLWVRGPAPVPDELPR